MDREPASRHSLTNTAKHKINNTNRNKNLTAEEKTREIAALYNTTCESELYAAIEKANCVFWGDTSNELYKRSIFDVAYDTACEEVMFSQEALEMTRPYMARQIAKYLEACATYEIILNAYDQVHGSGSTEDTHEEMDQRLAGVNSGVPGEGSIVSLYRNYFSKDKYIFVNKRKGNPVALYKRVRCQVDYAKNDLAKDPQVQAGRLYKATTPDYMKNNPLSASQVEDLAEYCKSKNVSLFDFLFNRMRFEPVITYYATGFGVVELQAFDFVWGYPLGIQYVAGDKNPWLVTGA